MFASRSNASGAYTYSLLHAKTIDRKCGDMRRDTVAQLSLFVLSFRRRAVVVKEMIQEFEGRASIGQRVPTFRHDFVDFRRKFKATSRRSLHPFAISDVNQRLVVGQAYSLTNAHNNIYAVKRVGHNTTEKINVACQKNRHIRRIFPRFDASRERE